MVSASYRKTDPRIWEDEVFDTLPIEQAFAALWLITGRATNRAGVAVLSLIHAAEKLRLDGIDTVWDTLSELSHKLGWPIERMGRNKVVMILRTHFRYNPPCNQKHLRGMLSDLADVPRCDLVKTQYTQTVRPYLQERWRGTFDAVCDTLYDTVPDTVPDTLRVARARTTSASTSEDPLPHGVGDTVSPRSKNLNPRTLRTNPRAVAEHAAADETKRRHRLLAAAERHADTKLADGTTVERGGIYDTKAGTLTWSRVSTERLEKIVEELKLLDTGGERKEVPPMD